MPNDDGNVALYFERKQIPELMEALITGLSYNRPEDPVAYLTDCLAELKKTANAKEKQTALKWDRFIKDSMKNNSKANEKQPTQLPSSFFFRQAPNVAKQDSNKKPVGLSSDKIVLVLGGPGSGKGTQCAKIVQDFGLKHISLGDLLRAEVEKKSKIGKDIDGMMKEGKIVPLDTVMQVLQQALSELSTSSKGVLIDGFPREMSQAIEFEKKIGKVKFVLYFECTEELLEKRLLKRGETSGRSDDNIESIKKRFKTFVEQSLPVIDYYGKQGCLLRISSEPPVDQVYASIRPRFEEAFPK